MHIGLFFCNKFHTTSKPDLYNGLYHNCYILFYNYYYYIYNCALYMTVHKKVALFITCHPFIHLSACKPADFS